MLALHICHPQDPYNANMRGEQRYSPAPRLASHSANGSIPRSRLRACSQSFSKRIWPLNAEAKRRYHLLSSTKLALKVIWQLEIVSTCLY
jgi:hypothetical protein